MTSALMTTTPTTAASRTRPVGDDEAQVQAHSDRDQEHAEREPLERRGDDLDLGMILGFGDQQAGEQRADDWREAYGSRRDAGQDHDQAGWRRGTTPGSWCGPPERRAGAGRSVPRRASPAIVRPPSHSVRARPSQPSADACGARAPSAKMIGTRARSSNSSIENALRPTGLVVPDHGQHQGGGRQRQREAEPHRAGPVLAEQMESKADRAARYASAPLRPGRRRAAAWSTSAGTKAPARWRTATI